MKVIFIFVVVVVVVVVVNDIAVDAIVVVDCDIGISSLLQSIIVLSDYRTFPSKSYGCCVCWANNWCLLMMQI